MADLHMWSPKYTVSIKIAKKFEVLTNHKYFTINNTKCKTWMLAAAKKTRCCITQKVFLAPNLKDKHNEEDVERGEKHSTGLCHWWWS